MVIKPQYTLDNDWVKARERLTSLEMRYDPATISRMEEIGVAEGWSCLEIGGGGGSIAAWLCQRAGPSGRVVATDINTRFLDAFDYANLKVMKHDIVTETLPAKSFDLIHERCVLMHLPQREAVLRKLYDALKPGGWMLFEDVDFTTMGANPLAHEAPRNLFHKVWEVFNLTMQERGADVFFGAKLFGLLQAAGFDSLRGEGRVPSIQRGTPDSQTGKLTIEQLREQWVASGKVTDEEIDAVLMLCDDPAFSYRGPLMMAAWGRKPKA